MSTDYFLKCEKCNKISNISFSRQAWGWGNTWPKNTFLFLIKHTRQCGSENITVEPEDCVYDIPYDNIPDDYCDLKGFEEV